MGGSISEYDGQPGYKGHSLPHGGRHSDGAVPVGPAPDQLVFSRLLATIAACES